MTSAQIAFKNFKQEFTKRINELSKIIGQPPPDVTADLAFPTVKGFFVANPEIHGRCLAKCPSIGDIHAFFEYVGEEFDEPVEPEKFELMKPVFYHIAKTIPQKINA